MTAIASPYALSPVLAQLNDRYTPLSFQERLRQLYRDFSAQDVLVTSSFGTQSIFLLYFLHRTGNRQKIHFLDTGYHFPETLAYKEEIRGLLNLDIIELKADKTKHELSQNLSLWEHQPNRCCYYNKVAPLQEVKSRHKVWLSGVRAYQTPERGHLKIWEEQDGLLKFHPLIDLDEGEFLFYQGKYQLPQHPVAQLGYGSIGCTHCTVKGEGRSGRWQGQNKTECGLHVSLPEPNGQ